MNSLSFISPSFLSIVLLDIVFLVGGVFCCCCCSASRQNFGHIFPSSLSPRESSWSCITLSPVGTVLSSMVKLPALAALSIAQASRVHYVLSVLWPRRQIQVPQEAPRKDSMWDICSNSFPFQKLGIGFSPAFHTELWKGIWQVSAPNPCSPWFPFSLFSVSAQTEETSPSGSPLENLNVRHVSVFSFPPQEEAGSWEFSPNRAMLRRGKN